jgi:hypothetical protein
MRYSRHWWPSEPNSSEASSLLSLPLYQSWRFIDHYLWKTQINMIGRLQSAYDGTLSCLVFLFPMCSQSLPQGVCISNLLRHPRVEIAILMLYGALIESNGDLVCMKNSGDMEWPWLRSRYEVTSELAWYSELYIAKPRSVLQYMYSIKEFE